MAGPLLNKNNSGEIHVPPTPPSGSCDIIPLAVKRIMQEARELANDPSTEYSAAPLEVCIVIFTIRVHNDRETTYTPPSSILAA